MLQLTYLILFLWSTLVVMPVFAAIKGGPACCTDCPGGHCPISKAPKKEETHGPACHRTPESQKCSLKSTGCDHQKPQLVFWYDAVLQVQNAAGISAPEVESTVPLRNCVTSGFQIDPPPPKHLL